MRASFAVVVATTMLGCGGAKDASTQTKVPVALAPDRTAVEDKGVRQGVRASLVCHEEADRVITAFLHGQPAPEVAMLADAVVDLAAPQTLKVEPSCKTLLIVRPAEGAKSPVEYHYSLFQPDRDPKAIAPCG